MAERHGFSFSPEAKEYVHDRAGLGLRTGKLANGKCEFPGDKTPCPNKPEPFVAHLQGCYETFLTRFPRPEYQVWKDDRRSVIDPTQNALMQCREHNAFHDEQERFQVESALAVTHKKEFVIYEPRHRKHSRHKRRR